MKKTNHPHVYEVKKLAVPLRLRPDSTHSPVWQQALELPAFDYPWRNEVAPATSFRALWDELYFYFLYEVEQDNIQSNLQSGQPVVTSDRVEIFFRRNAELNPYYSLEMDAQGRLLSTLNTYYRNIDRSWTWPAGHFDRYAGTTEAGYWVKGRISLASLRILGLLPSQSLQAGLFRGEYVYSGQQIVEEKWISWVPPDTPKPDFHTPSAFGLLKLID